MDCKNVVKLGEAGESLANFDASGYLVDIGCSDPARFDPMSDAEVFSAYDGLVAMQAAGVSKKDLQEAQTARGWVLDHGSLLGDLQARELARPSSYVRDPMHIMLCGGVVNCEVMALYSALRTFYASRGGRPFSFAVWREFVGAAWIWPRARAGVGPARDIFSDVREASSWKDKRLKAAASEQLRVIPLIRYFLEIVVPSDALVQERRSFNLCCEVVDLMQAVKLSQQHMQHMHALKNKISEFHQAHIDAYSRDFVIPKHHYMFHMTRQAEADGLWLDCFVHERKHQMIKDCSEDIKNTNAYEHSVLCSTLHSTMERLRADIAPDELFEPCALCQELSDAFGVPCRVSHRMRVCRMFVSVGDFLFSGEGACLVVACVLAGREFALLVEPLALVERSSRTSSRWGRACERELLRLSPGLVWPASCWHLRSDATILALGRYKIPSSAGEPLVVHGWWIGCLRCSG